MNKLLKYVLIGLALVVVFIGGFAGYVAFDGIPSYEPEEPELTVEVTPEKVELGAKIASMQCIQCHSSESGTKLTGKRLKDAPPDFGEIYASNITQDPEKGIGKWSDGQLYYFLRTGVRPDGSFAPVYMPKFHNMADEDLKAVIAFLKSDYPVVQPSKEEPPASKPSFLVKLLTHIEEGWNPVPFSEEEVVKPSPDDKLAYGKYLVTGQLDCYGCHSADFKTNNILDPEKSEDYLAGGNLLLNEEGQSVYSPNITMDKETGIGDYTLEEFSKAIKFGQGKDGNLYYPMPKYTALEDEEVEAIWEYLRSVPAIKKEVKQEEI